MRRRCYFLLRRCHDVPIRCRGDVPLRRRWEFHLRGTCKVSGTYRETSLRRRYDVLLPNEKLTSNDEVNNLNLSNDEFDK